MKIKDKQPEHQTVKLVMGKRAQGLTNKDDIELWLRAKWLRARRGVKRALYSEEAYVQDSSVIGKTQKTT